VRGKLWGGRFSRPTHTAVEEFTSSLATDQRLWEADLMGSIAHAKMLGACGILSAEDSAAIVSGLDAVAQDLAIALARGENPFDPSSEDIHSEIEKKLREKAGPVAGKLHVARSRNDQVATATRLYLRGRIDALVVSVVGLQAFLTDLA
jgi:argininosuccinate lyase